MPRSIYDLHRRKFEFSNPNWFRVGDEFKIIDNKIVYFRCPDAVRGSPSQYDSNTYVIKEPIKLKAR